MIVSYSNGTDFLQANQALLQENPYLSTFFTLDAPLLKQADTINYALRCEQGEPRFHVDRRVSGGRDRCGRLDGEAQFGEGAQLLLTVCGVQLPMDDLGAERVPLLDRLGDEPDASTDGDDFGCFEAFRDFACHGSRDVEPALELGVPTTATAAPTTSCVWSPRCAPNSAAT